MQAVIWIFSVLGVIGAGIGLGYLIYYLFWPKYAIKSEESVTRSEFEEFKADIEAKLKEGVTKPSELDALKTSLEAIEAKLKEEYVTLSKFDRFRDAIREIM